METTSNLVMNRLSASLEELGLDRRAYHILKRKGINRICDIIAHGESGILNIKGMGEITARHIFSVVARYLNIQQEELFSLEVPQNVKRLEEEEFDPLDASLSILNLPSSTLHHLNSFGLFLIRDLLGWRTKGTDGLHGQAINRSEIRRIYAEFIRYLDEDMESSTVEVNTGVNPQPIDIDLSIVLAAILKDERAIQIVKLRALDLRTLEEIANEMGGVSRERIRQIIDHVHQRIRENLGLFTICCNYLEEIAESLDDKTEQGQFTVRAIAEQYIPKLQDARISATAEELTILMAVIRLIAIHERPWIYEKLLTRWKRFSFSVCLATPAIKTFRGGEETVEAEEEKNRTLSYKELALTILSEEKKPLHWSKIAERAYRLGRRESFNSSALYNALMSDPDSFVRVDAGTYALAEWGYSRAATYPDIIASILKLHSKSLPSETIFTKVNEIRPIKQVTLTMLLDLHPRFYRSMEKTYGLRVWLPDREKQTLRTPEWLVEDSDSYKRLEHASQKGYDIESMLRADLDIDINESDKGLKNLASMF